MEEEEAGVTEVSGTVFNLIEMLSHAHRENGQLHYYATLDPKRRSWRRVMPVTPFVFELFIYNSIYQVDWPASLKTGRVVNHPRDGFTEMRHQSELEKFLKAHARQEPTLIYEAFIPIRDASLEGGWMAVVPDARISAEEGERFFEHLRKLREILRGTEQPEALRVNNPFFHLIAECRRYVYLVRNNIFHGSKTLGETYEPNQRQRIELYLAFVRCLNQLFFAVCDKIRSRVSAQTNGHQTRFSGW